MTGPARAPIMFVGMFVNHFWILLLAAGATFGTTALIVLLRAVKRGVFEDAEDTKFVVFHDDDEEDEPLP